MAKVADGVVQWLCLNNSISNLLMSHNADCVRLDNKENAA